MGFIDPDQCLALGLKISKSGYGDYVVALARAAGATG
jgi:glucose-1-phosphate thymidylyltransferase